MWGGGNYGVVGRGGGQKQVGEGGVGIEVASCEGPGGVCEGWFGKSLEDGCYEGELG